MATRGKSRLEQKWKQITGGSGRIPQQVRPITTVIDGRDRLSGGAMSWRIHRQFRYKMTDGHIRFPDRDIADELEPRIASIPAELLDGVVDSLKARYDLMSERHQTDYHNALYACRVYYERTGKSAPQWLAHWPSWIYTPLS